MDAPEPISGTSAPPPAAKSPWRFVKPTNLICLALSILAIVECAVMLHLCDYPWLKPTGWVAGTLAAWFPFNWALLYGSKWMVDAAWFARWKAKLNAKDPLFTDWLVVVHFAFMLSSLPLGLVFAAPLLFFVE